MDSQLEIILKAALRTFKKRSNHSRARATTGLFYIFLFDGIDNLSWYIFSNKVRRKNAKDLYIAVKN